VSNDYPPVLARLGVSAVQWEKLVRMTSRRFTRELDLMAKMFAEARRRSERTPRRRCAAASPLVQQSELRSCAEHPFFARRSSSCVVVRAGVEIGPNSAEKQRG